MLGAHAHCHDSKAKKKITMKSVVDDNGVILPLNNIGKLEIFREITKVEPRWSTKTWEGNKSQFRYTDLR
jgi:hypothetical protein